jgi:hypothetical protein
MIATGGFAFCDESLADLMGFSAGETVFVQSMMDGRCTYDGTRPVNLMSIVVISDISQARSLGHT